VAEAHLQLTGTRYRCVPYYIAVDEFDPLSRVFLEVLKHERDVGRLVRAFGFTERVVEDVLGDLIRRNKATLVITGNRREVRLLGDAVATPDPQPGNPLEIWQDDATRVILPAHVADQFERFHTSKKVEILSIPPGPGLIDEFRAASDAQLIEMLLLSDDKLRQLSETHTSLDRLKNRHRVRPQTLWLPVINAKIFGQSIPLIVTEAEELPRWVARVWSVALRQHAVGESGDLLGFHAATLSMKDLNDLLGGWRSTARAQAWRASVDDFLSIKPAPRMGYDLHVVREREANLSALLSASCSIELKTPAPNQPGHERISWVTPVLDEARDWTILLLPSSEQIVSLIELLRRRIDSDRNLPSNLILVVSSSHEKVARGKLDTFQKLLGEKRFGTIVLSEWSTAPSVAFSDRAHVLLRYASGSSVIDMYGESIGNEWLGIVQSLKLVPLGDDQAGEMTLLRRLRVRKEPGRESVRIGTGSESRPMYTLPQQLQGFRDVLMMAIVDPDMVSIEPGVPARVASSEKFDSNRSIGEQIPALTEKLGELSRQLELRPNAPYLYWSRLGTHDLLPTLTAVLTEPGRRSVTGEIHFLVSAVRIPDEAPTILELLENAVGQQGWTIHIGLGADRANDCEKELQSLRRRIPSVGLRLWRLPQAVPAHAIVIDNLVFLSVRDWLSTILEQPLDSANVGFAIEGAHLADTLRAAFKWGEELMRPVAAQSEG
jgi:hypothetical protein